MGLAPGTACRPYPGADLAQQYRQVNGHAQRLTPKEMPPVSAWYCSPYDTDVRYGRTRGFDWLGYKVHVTECYDGDLPHLITQVETTPATQQDHHALKMIQAALAGKHLTPQEHAVDAGYISAKRILESRDHYGIDLVGPVHVDPTTCQAGPLRARCTTAQTTGRSMTGA